MAQRNFILALMIIISGAEFYAKFIILFYNVLRC